MGRYVVRRVLFGFLVLYMVSTLVFFMMRILPGDTVLILTGEVQSTPEKVAQVKARLGLDKPIPVQYVHWMGNLLKGDLGNSMHTGQPIVSRLGRALPVTAELALLTLTIAVTIAIPVGVMSAIRQDSAPDYVLRSISILGLAIPNFWLATMIIVLPSIFWNVVPPLGFVPLWEDPLKNLRFMVLPAIALGFALSASMTRLTRATVLEVLRQDYIRTAWAKGLRERVVILRHALKPSLIPVVTLLGLDFGRLLGGTVIIETIFTIPGLGKLTVDSIFTRDLTQVQGSILLFSFIFISINLIVDLFYGWLDPRIRYG